MPYGYHPATHTPEGYLRGGVAAPASNKENDVEVLLDQLHRDQSIYKREQAYNKLKALGVNV